MYIQRKLLFNFSNTDFCSFHKYVIVIHTTNKLLKENLPYIPRLRCGISFKLQPSESFTEIDISKVL